ncbi:hypothetical protein HRS9122_10203 [Pyrenophora teres f. teres]|nr:hypothetical protein HRS9122_10203 [Pyrenophora teres f. teres]
MRSFQMVALSALAIGASADAPMDTLTYDATVYITSTVTRVNTVTLSSSPTGSAPVNMTSTISATHATIAPSYPVNATMAVASTGVMPTSAPSASGPVPSSSSTPFEGAASTLNVNAFIVALAAGLGYLVL